MVAADEAARADVGRAFVIAANGTAPGNANLAAETEAENTNVRPQRRSPKKIEVKEARQQRAFFVLLEGG